MNWNKLKDNEYLIENDDLVCKFVFYIDAQSKLTDPRTVVFLNSNKFSFELVNTNNTIKDIILDLASSLIANSQKFVSIEKTKEKLKIEDIYYPTSSTKKVYLKIRLSNYEDLEVQETYLYEKKYETNNLLEIKNKFSQICSLYDKLVSRTNHSYKNFKFSQLSNEYNSFCSKIKNSKKVVILFGEDFSMEKLEADNKKVIYKISKILSYFLYGIDSFISRISGRDAEVFVKEFSYEDFIEQYTNPKLELVVGDSNFSATDKLVQMILGDSSLLNADYKVNREQVSEQTKFEIISQLRNKTEYSGDSTLKEILTAPVEFATLDEVYDSILNKLDIVSMSKVAAFCLLKILPIQELKKTICRKVVTSLSLEQYTMIANFLEYAGDEISKEIGKSLLSRDDPDQSPGEAMLDEMNMSLEREDKICLAVFALIPAAIFLLKELIENREQVLENVNEDIQIIKKAINKRFEYFFDSSNQTFDILKSIKDGVIDAAKALLAATILYFINKLIQTIIDACDSKEQDSTNTPNNPFGKLNINDLFEKKPKDFYGIDDKILEDFLKDLSNRLTITEICLLLNGYSRNSILDEIKEVLYSNSKYESLRDKMDDFWKQFFIDLSKYIDQTICDKAISDYNNSKKILIELCSDQTKLKEQLLQNLFNGTVDLSDIFEQAQREYQENLGKFENIVDLFNQSELKIDFCQDSAVPFEHESEKHLSKIIVKNSIRPISKQFEYEAENFKKIFEDKSKIKENLQKFADYTQDKKSEKQTPIIETDSSLFVANKLRQEMQNTMTVSEVESFDDYIRIDGINIQYQNNKESILFSSEQLQFLKEKDNKTEFDTFKSIVKKISESNLGFDITKNNDFGYLGKVQESLLEQILRISSNNGLFKRENYSKFTFSSTTKSKQINDKLICEDSILSVLDFYERYRFFLDDKKYKKARCSLGREFSKYAVLKIACELFICSLIMKEVAKSFFVTSLFNEKELFNKNSLFFNKILSSIQQDLSSSDYADIVQILVNVQQKIDASDDVLDMQDVLSKQLSEGLTEIIIPKIIIRYINAGIDIGQNNLNTKDDIFFGSESFETTKIGEVSTIDQKLKLFRTLSPNVSDGPEEIVSYDTFRNTISATSTKKSGLYLEKFYNVEHNKDFYDTLKNDQVRNVFDLFVAYCRKSTQDTISFNDLFVPGFGFYENLSEQELETVQNDISLKNYDKISTFSKIYNVRGVINSNNFIKYYVNSFNSMKNIEKLAKDVKFANFAFSTSPDQLEFGNNPYDYFANNILNRSLSTLFNKFQYGLRLVAYVDNQEMKKLPNNVKMLLNKSGYYEENVGEKITKVVLLEVFENFYENMQNVSIFDVFYNISSKMHISKQKESNLLEKMSKNDDFGVIFGALRTQDMVSFAAIQNYELTQRAYPETKNLFSATIKAAKQNVFIQNSVISNDYLFPTLADSNNSGDSLLSVDIFQVVFKAMMTAGANVTDPTWKTPWFLPGPLTPIGVIAKSLEDKDESEESGSDKFMDGTIDLEDKVCVDKK